MSNPSSPVNPTSAEPAAPAGAAASAASTVSPGSAASPSGGRRLRISVASDYDSKNPQYVPVNTHRPVRVETSLGVFEVCVNIRHFVGSAEHAENSAYNQVGLSEEESAQTANLEVTVDFTPNEALGGDALLFGNDFTYSIQPYVPTTLLATGLKVFTWLIDPSTKGDVTAPKPYIYGSALSSFTRIDVGDGPHSTETESLHAAMPGLAIPAALAKRAKYFAKHAHQEQFRYEPGMTYAFRFSTNLIRLQDSHFAVSIPTYGHNTFDVNVLDYLTDVFNNVNFVVKTKGPEGEYDVGAGQLGVVIKFELL